MIPKRIELRQAFINAIETNDKAQLMVGIWGIGPNFHCVDPAFGEYSSVTPLLAAIERGNAKLVERLLTHHTPADPNAMCEGTPLFTSGDFSDFLYISPLLRCLQRHHLADPAHKQTFVDIYTTLRDHNADLYATPTIDREHKTPLQESWETNVDQQMSFGLKNLHAQLEEQYQHNKTTHSLKKTLEHAVQSTVNASKTATSTRKQKI